MFKVRYLISQNHTAMRLKVGWMILSSSKNTALRLKYAIWLVKIMTKYMQRQSSSKVHLNTITNGELSDPLCNSIKRSDLSTLNWENTSVFCHWQWGILAPIWGEWRPFVLPISSRFSLCHSGRIWVNFKCKDIKVNISIVFTD